MRGSHCANLKPHGLITWAHPTGFQTTDLQRKVSEHTDVQIEED
jgi:hypothetical protein